MLLCKGRGSFDRVTSSQGDQGGQGYVRDLNWSGICQGYVRDFWNFPEKSGISDLWLNLFSNAFLNTFICPLKA